jgi:hypothetical protein
MDDPLLQQRMANASPHGLQLYLRFVALLDAIGSCSVHPAKSAITFKGSRRGFCGAHSKGDVLVGYFDLMRAVDADPRVRSVSPYMKTLYVHQFRIYALEQIDETFKQWLSEAYGVGRGDHLKLAGGASGKP